MNSMEIWWLCFQPRQSLTGVKITCVLYFNLFASAFDTFWTICNKRMRGALIQSCTCKLMVGAGSAWAFSELQVFCMNACSRTAALQSWLEMLASSYGKVPLAVFPACPVHFSSKENSGSKALQSIGANYNCKNTKQRVTSPWVTPMNQPQTNLLLITSKVAEFSPCEVQMRKHMNIQGRSRKAVHWVEIIRLSLSDKKKLLIWLRAKVRLIMW